MSCVKCRKGGIAPRGAIKELEIKIPVVVRLAGTKVEEGRRIIEESRLTMISADSLAEAADKVVAAAKSSRAAA